MAELTKEQEENLAQLESPFLWPKWPLLPLKRRKKDGGFPDVATVVGVEGKLTTLVFDGGELLWGANCKGKSFDEILSMFKSQEYSSAEAIITDGWEVD